MKCNTFYEDQSFTSCFDSEGTNNTECPSYMSFLEYFCRPALKKVACYVYKDQLPGGRYETVDDVVAEQSQSIEKHNAYVERLFG